ncbi:hypothetical protein [Flavobacterium sp. JP2137]
MLQGHGIAKGNEAFSPELIDHIFQLIYFAPSMGQALQYVNGSEENGK